MNEGSRQEQFKRFTPQTIDVMEEWFWLIETGTANMRFPSKYPMVNEEEVNHVIKTIDGFFEWELSVHQPYWTGQIPDSKPDLTDNVPIDMPPDFNRLQGLSREAFVQDLRRVFDD